MPFAVVQDTPVAGALVRSRLVICRDGRLRRNVTVRRDGSRAPLEPGTVSARTRSENVAIKAASRREHESIARCCRAFPSATRQVVAKIGVSYRFSRPAFWDAKGVPEGRS